MRLSLHPISVHRNVYRPKFLTHDSSCMIQPRDYQAELWAMRDVHEDLSWRVIYCQHLYCSSIIETTRCLFASTLYLFYLHLIANKKLAEFHMWAWIYLWGKFLLIFSSGLHLHAPCTASEFLTQRLYLWKDTKRSL